MWVRPNGKCWVLGWHKGDMYGKNNYKLFFGKGSRIQSSHEGPRNRETNICLLSRLLEQSLNSQTIGVFNNILFFRRKYTSGGRFAAGIWAMDLEQDVEQGADW